MALVLSVVLLLMQWFHTSEGWTRMSICGHVAIQSAEHLRKPFCSPQRWLHSEMLIPGVSQLKHEFIASCVLYLSVFG